MIFLLDTTTPTARLTIIRGDNQTHYEWQAERTLAKGLLAWIRECFSTEGIRFEDVQGIGVKRGPGSFTGIRIGLTVMNTMAESLQIRIVGATDDNWTQEVVTRLEQGQDDKIVLPYYDRDATITLPRK